MSKDKEQLIKEANTLIDRAEEILHFIVDSIKEKACKNKRKK